MILSSIDLAFLFANTLRFFSDMNPACADILRIFVGTTGWIGGLALFMWLRDKKKNKLKTGSEIA
jgi:hypothetical protein